jgi:hypothetical protein
MPRRVYLLGVGLALVALALAFTDWALSLRPAETATVSPRLRPPVEEIPPCPGTGGPQERQGAWDAAACALVMAHGVPHHTAEQEDPSQEKNPKQP